MKAQVLNGYGGVDRFAVDDVPTPNAEQGQVLVRVRAIGINPMEVRIRSGSMRDQMPTKFPAILGTDVAGVVEGVGDGVSGLSVGNRVVGFAGSGAYAEYTTARADALAPIPDGLDFEQAATLPTAAETSRRGTGLLDPKEGETVVVNGAAGSVGSAAVQLLVRAGVNVIGTASEDNHDYVRSLGATPTTYGDGVVGRISELAPDGVDAVFDVTNHGFVDAAIELRGGPERIVTISQFDAGEKGVIVSYGDSSRIKASDIAPVVELAASGEFATEIARTFSFEDLPAAHEMSEQGHLRGKIVVTVPDAG